MLKVLQVAETKQINLLCFSNLENFQYLFILSIYIQCRQYSVMSLFTMFTIINKSKSIYLPIFSLLSSVLILYILSSILSLLSILYGSAFDSSSSSLWSQGPN